MNIAQAMTTLLGLDAPSWAAWRALIAGAFGCPLSDEQREIFRTLTKRDPLQAPCRELWLAVGRRGGKNRVSAAVAVFLALLNRWHLAAGEVGTVMILASDRVQARIAFRYVKGLLESSPVLRQEVAAVTADTITLQNGIEIAINTADSASVRGRTVVAAILDEYAHWPHEEAHEVLRALRPSMATQPEALLIVISSVYAAFGPFHDARRQHFGVDDSRVLYAVATSQQLNPELSDEFIAAELARDPIGNAAEYLSVERTDRESFIDAELVDSLTRDTPREIPHRALTPAGPPICYLAGLDVSGGRSDAAAAAIAMLDGDRAIVCALRRWPAPHDPAIVAGQVAEFLASYGLLSAYADQYGAEIARSLYREAGVTLLDAPDTRSDCYLRLLPLMTTGRVEFPPDPVLRAELLGLERRTSRAGRDSVDHRPNTHDDVANAVAIAAVLAAHTTDSRNGKLSVGYSQFAEELQRELMGPRRFDPNQCY